AAAVIATCRTCPYTALVTPEISSLSLHDALPLSHCLPSSSANSLHAPGCETGSASRARNRESLTSSDCRRPRTAAPCIQRRRPRSEEHTSELQSRFELVCRLLLEKKKKRRWT